MDRETRRALIDRYEAGYDAVVAVLDTIGEGELDVREAPGEWSPREVVHHLGDSEMTSAIRLRRLVAEEQPLVQGYDQEEFARRLYYDRPIEASLAAFKAARESTAEILERMSELEWARAGTHSESGTYTLDDWLRIYAEHAFIHADQILRALQAHR